MDKTNSKNSHRDLVPLKITITGQLGSGKSVVGKKLAQRYKIRYYSTGDMQRELAKERGVSTLKLNLLSEDDRTIDDYIDDFNRKLNNHQESFIVDSRLGWYFVEKAFRIFLQVEKEVAGRRIMGDSRRESERYQTLEEAMESIRNREESERLRYQQFYGVTLDDFSNYHLVVDTSHITPDETVEIIDRHCKRFRDGETFHVRI